LAWLKRFGLHLAAAVGATSLFVAAAAVGATQTRQQAPVPTPVATLVRTRTPSAQRKPSVEVATPAPSGQAAAQPGPSPSPRPPQTPAAANAEVNPERSLAGTVKDVHADGLDVVGVGGREWHVQPVPGALIRLNGKAARLDALQPGDGVVILGQAQPGPGQHFLAHAITAKGK
jgi:hypothetical protein